ncbi:ABC transporter substrate-binding protein [Pendulispora albinea]|uniref:ABC transporter substrate-binding protein n=1 Tax=Pendulispora albinea TaxID=2741071 RepID=A0ABZ2M7Z7_9BACT
MFTYTKCLVFGVAAVVSALVAGCSKDKTGTGAGGVPLVKAGALVTCTHLPYPPFQIEKDGKIVGFDVDVIDLVAKKLGVKQEFVDTQFENMKTGAFLNSGQCDLVAAGMTITEPRKKNLDFSDPYFDANQALIVKKGAGVTNLENLKTSGKKVGTQSQTTGEDFTKSKGFNPVSFDSSDALLSGLKSGQVDSVIEDHPVVQSWMKDSGNAASFDIVAYLDTGEQLGFAVKKGNAKLVAAINEVLKEARADGTYKRLYEQWFGPQPTNVTKP